MIYRIGVFAIVIAVGSSSAWADSGKQPGEFERFLYRTVSEVGSGFFQGMGQEIGRELTQGVSNALFPPQPNGLVSTSVFRDVLARVEQVDTKYHDVIQKMEADLKDRMTRREVYDLTMSYLREVNKDLAEVAYKVEEQRRTLEIHKTIMAEQRRDIDQLFRGQENLSRNLIEFRVAVDEAFERQGARIGRVEGEMASLREDYPRYRGTEQAELLGASGMLFLQKGDHREALRSFRFAHAYDMGEPCYLYGMALAYRGLGQNGDAEVFAARAIATDRKRSLVYSQIWKNMSYRIQGPDRLWLEALRADPMYGVKVPGMVRIPASLTAP